jgi:hypothetical protein
MEGWCREGIALATGFKMIQIVILGGFFEKRSKVKNGQRVKPFPRLPKHPRKWFTLITYSFACDNPKAFEQ